MGTDLSGYSERVARTGSRSNRLIRASASPGWAEAARVRPARFVTSLARPPAIRPVRERGGTRVARGAVGRPGTMKGPFAIVPP